MKFTGRELFELGVPQNKIKLFIGREFSSKDELLEELKPKEKIEEEKVFTWIDWLVESFGLNLLPMKMNGDKPEKMSKSELKRLFDSKSIEINGKFFSSSDECCGEEFPIKSFVWFPKSQKKKTTWV